MVKQSVRPHKRNKKKVSGYTRKKRKKGTKKIISSKPVKLYPVYNEHHEFQGWSSKKGYKRK